LRDAWLRNCSDSLSLPLRCARCGSLPFRRARRRTHRAARRMLPSHSCKCSLAHPLTRVHAVFIASCRHTSRTLRIHLLAHSPHRPAHPHRRSHSHSHPHPPLVAHSCRNGQAWTDRDGTGRKW
jgi:hypothetical protein